HAQYDPIDLIARTNDQIADGTDGLAVLVGHLGADQLLARQVLARRLALEERVGRDCRLGGLLLWLLLRLGGRGERQRRHQKQSGEPSEHERSFPEASADPCDSGGRWARQVIRKARRPRGLTRRKWRAVCAPLRGRPGS